MHYQVQRHQATFALLVRLQCIPSPSECINNLVTVVVLAMPQAIADIVPPASTTCSGLELLSRLGPLSASITMRVRPFRRECMFEVPRVQVL